MVPNQFFKENAFHRSESVLDESFCFLNSELVFQAKSSFLDVFGL